MHTAQMLRHRLDEYINRRAIANRRKRIRETEHSAENFEQDPSKALSHIQPDREDPLLPYHARHGPQFFQSTMQKDLNLMRKKSPDGIIVLYLMFPKLLFYYAEGIECDRSKVKELRSCRLGQLEDRGFEVLA